MMDNFLYKIEDVFDSATDYLIDYAYYNMNESFITALIFFYAAIFVTIVFGILSKAKKISVEKGVFYPTLMLSAIISLTAGILCAFWIAAIICVVCAVVVPVTEKKEYERYTGKKSKLTVKNMLRILFCRQSVL